MPSSGCKWHHLLQHALATCKMQAHASLVWNGLLAKIRRSRELKTHLIFRNLSIKRRVWTFFLDPCALSTTIAPHKTHPALLCDSACSSDVAAARPQASSAPRSCRARRVEGPRFRQCRASAHAFLSAMNTRSQWCTKSRTFPSIMSSPRLSQSLSML